jgi:hypothetical protein
MDSTGLWSGCSDEGCVPEAGCPCVQPEVLRASPRTRTETFFRTPDLESGAPANFASEAWGEQFAHMLGCSSSPGVCAVPRRVTTMTGEWRGCPRVGVTHLRVVPCL